MGMYEEEVLAIQALTNDEVTSLSREFDSPKEAHRNATGLRRAIQALGLGWKVRIQDYNTVVVETQPQVAVKGGWNVVNS